MGRDADFWLSCFWLQHLQYSRSGSRSRCTAVGQGVKPCSDPSGTADFVAKGSTDCLGIPQVSQEAWASSTSQRSNALQTARGVPTVFSTLPSSCYEPNWREGAEMGWAGGRLGVISLTGNRSEEANSGCGGGSGGGGGTADVSTSRPGLDFGPRSRQGHPGPAGPPDGRVRGYNSRVSAV